MSAAVKVLGFTKPLSADWLPHCTWVAGPFAVATIRQSDPTRHDDRLAKDPSPYPTTGTAWALSIVDDRLTTVAKRSTRCRESGTCRAPATVTRSILPCTFCSSPL